MELKSQSTGLGSIGQQTDARPTKGRDAPHGPREYARRLSDYSKLNASVSLFLGGHFKNLATYLNGPFDPRAPNFMTDRVDDEPGQPYKLVSLYDLDPSKERKPKHIESVSDFDAEAHRLVETSLHGHLLFVRGHPSPDWLLAIGTRYQLDPEYIQRHLDFCVGQPEYFPLPSLPSTSSPMIRLRITTIGGSQNPPSSNNKQENLEKLRIDNLKAKCIYREKLRMHSSCKLGDSIVRDSFIHDLCHFSLEQDISVHVCRTRKSWAGIIWLDHGNTLSTGLASSLSLPMRRQNSWQIRYLPVVQHKPGVALRSRSKLLAPVSSTERKDESLQQSASLLHLDYGRGLDRNVMAHDSFYALHELLIFAAFSEVQFLNMLDSKLQQELDHLALIPLENTTMSNLVYHQQVLDRHILRLRENLVWINENTSSYTSKGASGHEELKEAVAAAKTIEKNYSFLLDRAIGLSEKCNRGIQVIMNNVVVKESREAILQAEGVAKLTRLAFIFIPLSFTCSFFGMNFEQFGTGTLQIWVWFICSLPIAAVSMVLMRYDIANVLTCVRGFTHTKKKLGTKAII